jgi:hypothetical protein
MALAHAPRTWTCPHYVAEGTAHARLIRKTHLSRGIGKRDVSTEQQSFQAIDPSLD